MYRACSARGTCFAIAVALLVACGGDGGGGGRGASGISTRTPAPPSTATPEPRPEATATPSEASPEASPEGTATVEPDEVARRLAALGAGEDPGRVMQGLTVVAPRCQEDRETFAGLLERGWRILNEQRGLNVPVSAMLARIAAELPPGEQRFNCESLIAAVIVDLTS